MTARVKAACRVCKKPYTLTTEGVLYDHSRRIWKGGSNYESVLCPGSKQLPLGATPVHVAVNVKAPGKAAKAKPVVRAAGGRGKPGKAYVGSNAPPGAMAAQQRAYVARGLTWSPQAIAALTERHTRGRKSRVEGDKE